MDIFEKAIPLQIAVYIISLLIAVVASKFLCLC